MRIARRGMTNDQTMSVSYNSSPMRDIAIIGAGALGGALAHLLARRNAAATIRIVDDHGRAAEGQALDIMEAAPIEQFASRVTGSASLAAAGGADVVVVADRFGGTEWQGDEGLALLTRLLELAPSSIILCAGASQRDLVDRGVRELHIDRRRVIGSAPEALASGARALIALALNRSPGDVAVTVLGNPPAHIVVPWNDASVGGDRLTNVIDDAGRRRLAARIAAMWPPGPLALAAVAGKAVDAMLGGTRTAQSAFVGPETAGGERMRTAALPVTLGPDGVDQILVPKLSVADQVALDTAILR